MERLIVFVVCSLLCIISVKPWPVKDSDKPAIHQILEGKDLKVVCNTTEETETGIYWRKNDTKAPFREEGNTLSFQNIRRNATGEYICYSENVTVVEVIKVDVLYPAEITEFSIDKTVIKGDEPLNVHCKFEGNPDPNFIIMNNNSRYQHVYMDATGSHVDMTNQITNARCEDSGPWICTGRNSLNKKNVTRSGNVTVFCGPHPNYDQMETKYKVKTRLGNTAYLVMNNFGNPHPKYTWSHNEEIIASDKHVDLGIASVLNISNVREEDFGTYTLLMENIYGQYRSKYELLPPGPPQRPMDLRYYDLTHDSVHLEWFAGVDMGSIQHFLVLRVYDGVTVVYSEKIFDTSRGGLYDYTVTDLTPATVYRFVISADNGFWEPVLSYNSVEFETLDAPTTTTTATTTMTSYWFRLSDTTWGIILISFSGALIFIALFVGLVFIMYKGKYGNVKTPYKSMPRKSRHIQKAPLQLSVDNLDMRKVALT